MNRPGYSPACRCCGLDLARLRRRAEGHPALSAEIQRQMDAGICDSCHRARYKAAIEYERACTGVRLVQSLGAGWSGYPPRPHPALREAMFRVNAADLACVRLKMWSAAQGRGSRA